MKAIAYACAASFLFALMNASAKHLSDSITVPEIVFYRGLIGVLITLAVVRWRSIPLKVNNWPLLVSRGFFGGASLLMAFFAISQIALAEASFLAHLSPLFTVALGFMLLKERMPAGFSRVLLPAVIGALLVASPWRATMHALFVTVGVVGAVLSASASLAIRQLSKDHNNHTIMLGFLVTATVLPLPFISWEQTVKPTTFDAAVILFLGSVSFLGQYCLTEAYRLEKAGLIATVRYIGIVFNIALGFAFWGEVPPWTSFLGGALIVFSCLYLPYLQSRRSETR